MPDADLRSRMRSVADSLPVGEPPTDDIARRGRGRAGRRVGAIAVAVAIVAPAFAWSVATLVTATRPGASQPATTSSPNPGPHGSPIVTSFRVGGYPIDVAVGAGSLWVADNRRGAVLQVDPRTGNVLRIIPAGGPDATTQSVAYGDGIVWSAPGPGGEPVRIDAASGRPMEGLGNDVLRLLINDVAVGFGSGWGYGGAVERIDPRDGSRIALIETGNFSNQSGPFLAVGAGAVWVSGGDSGFLFKIDPTTNAIVDRIAIGHRTRISPGRFEADAQVSAVVVGGGAVWVCCDRPGRILRVDPATDRISETIQTSSDCQNYPGTLAFGEGSLWFTTGCRFEGNSDRGSLWRIDPTNGRIAGPVGVGSGPGSMTAGQGFVWLTNGVDGTVWRVDASRFDEAIPGPKANPSSVGAALVLLAVLLFIVVGLVVGAVRSLRTTWAERASPLSN